MNKDWNAPLVRRPVDRVWTRVTLYERVASGLASGIVVTGAIALILVLIFFAPWKAYRAVPDSFLAYVKETSNSVEIAEEVDEPIVAEIESTELDLSAATESVNVVSTVQANDGNNANVFGGEEGSWRRKDDPEPNDFPVKRWQIEYEVETIDGYTKMLDHFGVELAGAGRELDDVIYVKKMGGEAELRVGQKRDERRIYFCHAIPRLREWDLQLLQKAHSEKIGDRIPLNFFPVEVINRLHELESERLRADGKEIRAIERTRFMAVHKSDGYEFELVEIAYTK
ncbi:MAG: hypothetical protein JNL67_01570 [Planctomycetaceae bacterium]|nr:hypothetical protein [Planctomycetaceae bacterium]